MPEVLDKLINDHRNFETLMQIIEQEMRVFETGEHPDYELVRSVLNYLLTYPDLHHHPLEDVVVRKLICRTTENQVPGPAELAEEHRRLASTIRRFLAALNNILIDVMLPRDWFCNIAREFVAFQRKHMQMEEVVIFAMAKRSLSAAEWSRIATHMGAPADPLFGPDPDADFAELRARLGTAPMSN